MTLVAEEFLRFAEVGYTNGVTIEPVAYVLSSVGSLDDEMDVRALLAENPDIEVTSQGWTVVGYVVNFADARSACQFRFLYEGDARLARERDIWFVKKNNLGPEKRLIGC